MKVSHARKRTNVGPPGANTIVRSKGTAPSGTAAVDQPSPAELEAFYSDPRSLDPLRLVAVERFVHRHGAGAGARAEYLRFRRKLQMSRNDVIPEAVTD
jgi:hypothetical protein